MGRDTSDETFMYLGAANAVMCDSGFGPVFTTEAEISDHPQVEGQFRGQTLRKIFQPGQLPHMAMVLKGKKPRVVSLKRGARELL